MADQLDILIAALTAWKENRGGGTDGMQSVLNVIVNRSIAQNRSLYRICMLPWQFSSMTDPKDPQLALRPASTDPLWIEAQQLANAAAASTLEDITGGATSYYALSMVKPPSWAATMTQTCEIKGQVFFK